MNTRSHTSLCVRAFILGALLLSICAGSVATAEASPVIRTGEKVSLNETQTVSGDFYVSGWTVSISGVVAGDLYTAGRTVVVNGEIEEDAVVAAESAQIHGSVGDDVRVIARDAVIAEHVGGDVVVISDSLSVLSTAVIEGDLLFFGGEAEIAGDVNGSIGGRGGSVRIDSSVGGDVDIQALTLTLGDRAYIDGGVTVRGSESLVRAPGSVVVNDVRTVAVADTAPSQGESVSVIPLLTLLFTTLVYLLLFREQLAPFVSHLTQRPAFFGLVGLVSFVVLPIVGILLISSLLGIPVGIVVFTAYMLLVVISWSLGGIITGAFLARVATGKYSLSLLWSLAGTALFALMLSIPVAGLLMVFIITFIIMGSIVTLLYQKVR